MRRILDKLFEKKKLSLYIPFFVSVLLYLLFIIFGMTEDKAIFITTPIVSAVWFFGVFFVIYVQINNKRCPEGFLNFFELFATVIFGIYSVISVISFFVSGFQNFTPLTSAAVLTYSAVSLSHSKRTK